MKRNFNQQAALMTFCAAVLVFVISVGITRFYGGEDITVIGALVFWIVALAACIITGLVVPQPPKVVSMFEPKDFIKKRKRKKKKGPGRPKKS